MGLLGGHVLWIRRYGPAWQHTCTEAMAAIHSFYIEQQQFQHCILLFCLLRSGMTLSLRVQNAALLWLVSYSMLMGSSS